MFENILTKEQLVRFECAKLVASAGADPYEVEDMANPIAEWVLGTITQPILVKADGYEAALKLHNKQQSAIFAHLNGLGSMPLNQQKISAAEPATHKCPTLGDIVLVQWVDSSRTTDWTFQAPTLARVVHDSVGYLSHTDEEAINVRPHRAIDADGDEQHVGDMTIPRRAILSIQVLR